MKAKVYISYKEGILDPQGKTVGGALDSMGIQGIEDLRIGKYIEIVFGDISKQKAEEITDCLLYTSPSPRDVEECRMRSYA